MKLIKDKFTNLPVSRQRKYQLRRVAAGWCNVPGCKNKMMIGEECPVHYILRQRYQKRKQNVKKDAVRTKSHRQAVELGLGEFYVDKNLETQFRWTDKTILRLLKNGK